MRIKTISVFATAFLFCAVAGAARADDQSEWMKAKREMKQQLSGDDLTISQRCDIVWNTLWPWAKKGSLEARASMLMNFFALGMRVPGHTDKASSARDFTILTIHATGYKDKDYEEMEKAAYLFFPSYQISKTDPSMNSYASYFTCISNEKSQRCADQAVEENLVPSFEDYAAEVDWQISNEKKSICGGGLSEMKDLQK